MDIGAIYARAWQKNSAGQKMMKGMINRCEGVKSVLCMIYGTLCGSGALTKIEELPVDLLFDLESEATEWNPSATGTALTKLMKCIWTMNYLLTKFEQ